MIYSGEHFTLGSVIMWHPKHPYVVVDSKRHDLAIRNLKKYNHREELVRQCFEALFSEGTIVDSKEHDKLMLEQKAEEERLKEWSKKWNERREKMRSVTAGRLRKMLKYFCTRRSRFLKRRRRIYVEYDHNDSMGGHHVRKHSGVPIDFGVTTHEGLGWSEFQIWIRFKDGHVTEEHFSDNAEFVGPGAIQECNSGPYCYFTVKLA